MLAVLRDKLQMAGMDLVIILRLLIGKHQIQSDLVGLIHDITGTAHHPADMEMK